MQMGILPGKRLLSQVFMIPHRAVKVNRCAAFSGRLQAVEKARCAIFSAETGFTCACGAAGEPCKETLLRKASEPTAHVAGFGLQSEGTQVMRKGSMTTERCHAVPAKGRNRTAQIGNLGRAT
ncbi:MAG: hypothetical protein MRZ54_09545, partial [Clostridiales bacterium]|nr:hypothetical protein [Clostridiales bacterium]